MRYSIMLVFVAQFYALLSHAQNVGINIATPRSRLHVNGTSWFQGDNTPLSAAAGKGIGIGHTNSFGYIFAYDYGTPSTSPLALQIAGGNVGIGTTTPAHKLTVYAGFYGIEHTDGNVRLATYLNSSGGWIGTLSNHPLHFFANDGSELMTVNQAGQVGIGTSNPLSGYRLDVKGYVRAFDNISTGFVAQTTGGTNAWARYYMRSATQGWLIGTSENFNGNQLYIADENSGQTRLSIQPGGGAIALAGNVTQNNAGLGMPKAMVYLNPNGTIARCYNGITGATTGNCGFSPVRVSTGNYQVNFGFDVTQRFVSVSPESPCCAAIVSASFALFAPSSINVAVLEEQTFVNDVKPVAVDRAVMIIMY